jgi:hypothetical protein
MNMKFMLLCYDDEQVSKDAGPGVHEAAMNEAVALTHELHLRGQYILSSPLHPVAAATSVRIRDGKRRVTDGPFAETREVLGGFHLIHANTLQEAIDIAGRHPGARLGTVEVRPVLEIPNQPEKSS